MNAETRIDCTGQVVLVTGGVSGIGAGIAERFLDAGATVVTCSRRVPERLPVSAGRTAEHQVCDVRMASQCQALVAEIHRRHGRLDVLINNAGGSSEMPSATAEPARIEKVIQLNLTAAIFMSQAAYLVMKDQASGGSIVNISSVAAVRSSPYTAAYGAAKAGLLNLTESLAMEWGPQRVRVNALIVGLVATANSLEHYGGEAGVRRIGAMLPLQRMGAPRDVANACLFLASELSDYISGAQIAVHGGGERPVFLDLARGPNTGDDQKKGRPK